MASPRVLFWATACLCLDCRSVAAYAAEQEECSAMQMEKPANGRRNTVVELPRDQIEVAAAGRVLACAEGLRTDGCQFFSSAMSLAELKKIMDDTVNKTAAVQRSSNRSVNFIASKAMSAIAVVAVCIPGNDNRELWTKMCDIAHSNYEAYCAKHGYRLFFHDSEMPELEGRSPLWGRIPAVRRALREPGVNAVFYMDSDSLFMNGDLGLESLLPTAGKQVTFSGDSGVFVNSGHMMFTRSPWTDTFLTQTWEVYPPPLPLEWQDNAAMIYILSGKKDLCRKDSQLLQCRQGKMVPECDQRPQRDMNSYIDSFKPGDLILHFAGHAATEKLKAMEKYAERAAGLGLGASVAQLELFHSAVLQFSRGAAA